MSQMLERLLPTLLRHLSGDIMFNTHSQETDYVDKKKNNKSGNSSNSLHSTANVDSYVDSNNDSNGHSRSAQRWRRCVELWRHLLGCDRLFLSLLFHSGCLWSIEWSPSLSTYSNNTADTVNGRESRSWSKSVMWFLQLHEEDDTAKNSSNNNNNNTHSDNPSVAINTHNHSHTKGSSKTDIHMYVEDEVAVQRTAMALLGEWFSIVDSCGKQFSRAYYFSCALKIAALVGNLALVEDIPHLHDIVMQEPRSVSQFSAFCSILLCLIVEEAREQQPFRLQLPPPFFLLNFNLIGRGSRIGVWIPRKSSNVHSGNDSHNNTNNNTVCAQEAQFHSCEVCSYGVMLRLPSDMSINSAGDLILGVRLLDEAYVQMIDVLPVIHYDGEYVHKKEEEEDSHKHYGHNEEGSGSQHHTEKKRRGRNGQKQANSSTAINTSNTINSVSTSPCRCWSAFSPLTQSYIRVDLLQPRAVSAIVPSMSTGGTGRRRGHSLHNNHNLQEEMTINTVPLRRSNCITAQRDPLATIVFALAITARRLIGCRGLFIEQPPIDINNNTDNNYVHSEDTVNEENNNISRTVRRQTFAAEKLSIPPLYTSEAEFECLIECAIHLFIESLLLSRALSKDVVPYIDEWAMEVTSNTIDLALATPEPILRYMHTIGYALCLVPHPHQSLLITVGLFATLAQRQRDSNKLSTKGGKGGNVVRGTGWWEVFKVCVLKDAVIPGQLCSGIWELVERVERSLRVTPNVRLHNRHNNHQKEQKKDTDISANVDSNTQTVHEEKETQKKETEYVDNNTTPPRRRLALLSSRRSTEKDGTAKKLKTEIPATPLWLRAARAVDVSTQQHNSSSLRDRIMAMWWSLESAAAGAA